MKEIFPGASNESEISPAEREISEKIEKLLIDDGEKMDLTLVWQDFKKATDLEVYAPGNRDDKTRFTKVEAEEVQTVLNDMGLRWAFNGATKLSEEDASYLPTDRGREYGSFDVAKNEEDLKALRSWRKHHDIKTTREAGRIFGFPPTAIDAFCKIIEEGLGEEVFKKYSIEHEELPDDIKGQDFLAFAQFRLSREHWQEELETAKEWAGAIKRLNPALYDRTVTSYKDQFVLDGLRKMIAGESFAIEDNVDNDENTLSLLSDLLDRVASWAGRPEFKIDLTPSTHKVLTYAIGDYKEELIMFQKKYGDKKIPNKELRNMISGLRKLI